MSIVCHIVLSYSSPLQWNRPAQNKLSSVIRGIWWCIIITIIRSFQSRWPASTDAAGSLWQFSTHHGGHGGVQMGEWWFNMVARSTTLWLGAWVRPTAPTAHQLKGRPVGKIQTKGQSKGKMYHTMYNNLQLQSDFFGKYFLWNISSCISMLKLWKRGCLYWQWLTVLTDANHF